MTINELNSDILLEKDMAELALAFNDAKEELRNDVDVKITLEKIKGFVKKWEDFTENFTAAKKQITVIEDYSKKILNYLQNKINAMGKVKTVAKSEIAPLQDYLDDFKIKIEVNLDIQKRKYKAAMARR